MSPFIISLAVTVQGSLADASPTQVLSPALNWIQATLFGSIATAIAVIAIASIGFVMLSGRVSVRRGITILLGCFVLFGAPILAKELRSFSENETQIPEKFSQNDAPIFIKIDNFSHQNIENSFDPYAGAAVQR